MEKITARLIFSIFFIFISISPVRAAFLSLSPDTQTIDPGQTFKVKVNINTQGEDVIQGHAFLPFNTDLLELVEIKSDTFFPIVLYKYFSERQVIDLVGTIAPNTTPIKGIGKIAEITFKGKSGGETNLEFHCVQGQRTNKTTTDSDILRNNSTDPLNPDDIITCSDNGNARIQIRGAGPGTPSPYISPVPGTPTCDICGYCQGREKPPNWQKCMDCYAKPSHTYTVAGCVPNTASGLGQLIISYAVSLAGGIAFLAFLYGAFLILTSKGDAQQLAKGRSIAISSIIGLLIIFFAVFILNFVGVQIMRIPGFRG